MTYSTLCRAAALLLLAATAACSSGKEDPAPTTSLSWTVDGSTHTASTQQRQATAGTISITGTVNTNGIVYRGIILDIPRSVGTHAFAPNSPASAIYYTSSTSTAAGYYAGADPVAGTVTGAGTIVVTTLTASVIIGTFTFTGIDDITGASKTVTNGRFSQAL